MWNREAMDPVDLLLHPVRLRIVHALSGDRVLTIGQLVAYLGLDPKVRQSGSEPARLGRISKQGSPRTR